MELTLGKLAGLSRLVVFWNAGPRGGEHDGCGTASPSGALDRRPWRFQSRGRAWSDEELVAKLANLDPEASAEFVRRFEGLVVSIAKRRGCAGAEPEDLVQELWLYLSKGGWQAVISWEQRAPLAAYVSVIASRFVDQFLKNLRAKALDEVSMEDMREYASPKSDVTTVSEDLLVAFRQCFKALPEKHQLAIGLRFRDGLTHNDIAELLGISPGSSRKRVFDGLRRLERMLRETYPHLVTELRST